MARQRARIRKHSLEEMASLSKVANPGKLKRYKEWITRYKALKNYLSNILGHEGVSLRYVIRYSVAPDYNIESQPDYDFKQLLINCVILIGMTYNTDARKVNQLIHGLVQCETAETWMKPKERKQYG